MSLEFFITLLSTILLLVGYAIGRTDRLYRAQEQVIKRLMRGKK